MKKSFVEKEELSIQDYTKLLGDTTHANIFRNGEFAPDKYEKMKNYVIDMFCKTKNENLSTIEIAVAGLCSSMNSESRNVEYYIIPIAITNQILASVVYQRGYHSKNVFKSAPYSDMSMRMDSLDLAIMGKINTNFEGKENMSAKEFHNKFGGVEQNEVTHYYNQFAENAFKYINNWVKQECDEKNTKPIETTKIIEKQNTIKNVPDWLINI